MLLQNENQNNLTHNRTFQDHLNMTETREQRPPLPPFSYNDAVKKVRMAEDAWNTRDPDKVKMAYSLDTKWRNRSDFIGGRDYIRGFLSGKCEVEREYRLIKLVAS